MDVHEAAIAHVNRAWEWFAGMVALSATNLGLELGLFDYLKARGPARPDEMAAALGLQPRPVDVWAKALVQYDLLADAGDGRVAMTPGLELMVCEPRTLFYLGPSLTYHARFLARDFLDLNAFFKDGVPAPPSRHGAPLSRNIAEQTAMMHAVFVTAILPELPDVLSVLQSGANVLDAGCGAANLGILLCSNFPGVHYTGVDLDDAALADAHEVIAGSALEARMTVVLADAATVVQPSVFDLAFLFLSLHEIALDERPAVASALHAGLKPGGALVLLDETYPEALAEAANRGARMGLHFEYTEMLWGSRVATKAEIDALLREAGFITVERRQALEGSFEVIVARKA
jgi:SAM-dependent methyltransferase